MPQPLQTHTAPPQQQPQSHPAPPRLAAHVAVPAALLRDDDDMPPLESAIGHGGPSAAGHSHDGQVCLHAHGPVSPARTASPKSHSSSSSAAAHGHSHGDGSSCSGDHGHSSASSISARKFIPPSSYEDAPSSSLRPVSGSLPVRVMAWASLAWRGGGDPRSVLWYVLLKLSMMSLQFLWGIYSGNLGIVSSSFHTGFDVLALCCSLVAMLLAKYPPAHPFSYGLDRTEVTAAFTNTIFLFFVATFQIIETFHTGYAPPEIGEDDVVLAMAGLAIDVVGLGMFGRYTSLKAGGAAEEALAAHAAASAQGASVWSSGAGGITPSSLTGPLLLGANPARGHFENMHGVSLHVVADLIGHVSLLGAVWIFARYPGFPFVFALSFLFSAVVIIKLVLPLFQTTASILLMTTPPHLQQSLDRGVREISFYDGVLELRAAHWWMQSPGSIVGSMHLRIRSDAQEQVILAYVQGVLGKFCQRLTVQVEKDAVIANSWIQQQISP